MNAEHQLFADYQEDTHNGDVMAARQTALELLEAVIAQKQDLTIALEDSRPLRTLPGRERAFARMLTSTTLRRLGQIDDLIERAQDRPESLKNLTLRNILRLGVCQIMFMHVPDHAAVDTSVRLAVMAGLEGQKGFVNALLRTMTRAGKEWEARQDPANLNIPAWLLKAWIADWGLRTAGQIALSSLAEAPLDITVKEDSERAYWSSALKASSLNTGTLRRADGAAIRDLEGFAQGAWWVQDAAAAIPARLFGNIHGEHVIDLCAAPGGKTMQLAAQGASVTAVDRSAQRLKRLEENLKRMKLESRVEVIASDASVWRPRQVPGESAGLGVQRILLDAPCSATGTIRRHPDILHLKTPRDMESLAHAQWRILNNAARMLGEGGILVYCVCSLQKEEGEAQIERLLAENENLARVPISAKEIGGYEDLLTPEGDLRIFPFHLAAHGGMDGFYVARLTKISP